jgi:hypothetical protein
MLDPVTVIATASAAYNALKKGIEIGRELQDMGGQLATWAGAIADIEYLAKKAEDPPWWRAGSNVQVEAIEIFAAKKKIEAQRNELKHLRPVFLRPERLGGIDADRGASAQAQASDRPPQGRNQRDAHYRCDRRLGLGRWCSRLGAFGLSFMGIAAMTDFIPDKKTYQSNRRRMAWAALAMMIVCTGAVIIDPARMAQADAILMMMYGSLSALVGAYFGFANMGAQQPPERRRHEEDDPCER